MIEIDPLDPGFYAGDPHPTYARLRREAPVCRHEAAGLWTVARHADVLTVSRDPETFCSGKGVLPTDRRREVSATDSILFLDPPKHGRHRRLVSPAFTPKRIAAMEPVVRKLAVELVGALEPDEPVDFVEAVAAPLPIIVIAEMLGVPSEDRDRFRVWSDAMIAAATEHTEDALVRAAELWEYFKEVVDTRRAAPSDAVSPAPKGRSGDLISVLVTAEVNAGSGETEPLTTDELLGFCMTLLVAGNETTRNLLAGGARALAEHPDQLARLAGDPSLVASAVEEMLRWVTPVMSFARTATRDVEVGGVTIGEGDFVLMLYASANRDEEVFGETADRFDVARDPNPHVAFGFGEHFCLGASLARLEGRVLFEELLARFPRLSPGGDPERLASVLMNGHVRLPLVMHS